jgi:protocatechuate 3,4-dioxygenase, alpha subunit
MTAATSSPPAKPLAPGDGQAPHLVLSVFARGLLQRLVTRIYFEDEFSANGSDPLLRLLPSNRRNTLMASGDRGILLFDIHLQGRHETVFLAY